MKATHKQGDGPYLDLGDQLNLCTEMRSKFLALISFRTNQIPLKLFFIVTGMPYSRSSNYVSWTRKTFKA